ncbi:hypothetical protein VMCG_08852 [Cytospora schulzeri]|uniref:Uncharacterized protein n=1 Tax=Cytospora schulzeri TaxID=448051 RepID=A0A423VUM1_9PEZI|nr:hypothetical protein VMCG_08852 [Valsa malicola]
MASEVASSMPWSMGWSSLAVEGRGLEVEPVQLVDEQHAIIITTTTTTTIPKSPPPNNLPHTTHHLPTPTPNNPLIQQDRRTDPVRHAPSLLVIKRRKQRIVHGVPDLHDRPAHPLAEAPLVAELPGQGRARHEDDRVAQHRDLEDLAVALGEALEGVPCVGGVDV